MNDPKHIVIKVTDGEASAYFVHFDRDSHTLIDVYEYKQVYTPTVGQMSPRTKIIVDLAKSRIGMPLEATVRRRQVKITFEGTTISDILDQVEWRIVLELAGPATSYRPEPRACP